MTSRSNRTRSLVRLARCLCERVGNGPYSIIKMIAPLHVLMDKCPIPREILRLEEASGDQDQTAASPAEDVCLRVQLMPRMRSQKGVLLILLT